MLWRTEYWKNTHIWVSQPDKGSRAGESIRVYYIYWSHLNRKARYVQKRTSQQNYTALRSLLLKSYTYIRTLYHFTGIPKLIPKIRANGNTE